MSTNGDKQTGFVGWFDILGYREFLGSNSELDYCIRVIEEVINGAESEVMKEFEEFTLARIPAEMYEDETFLRDVRKSIRWVVFADTVVLVLPVQTEEIPRACLRVATYLHIARSVFIHFLGTGMPLRAAISFGTYFIREHPPLFAGKPLLESQQWADKQQWSGCVLTPTAKSILNQILAECEPEIRKLLAGYVVRYSTKDILPPRVITDTTMLCLNWPKKIGGFKTEADLPQLIKEQFLRHGKEVDPKNADEQKKLQQKICNTIKFARYCRKSMNES